MEKILIIVSIIFIHFQPFGQCNYIPYYNITAEAEWHYDNGRYDKAEILFEQAFKQIEVPKTKDIWLYSIILSKKGKKNKVYRLLKKHIQEIGGIQKKIDPFLKKDSIILTDKQITKINSFQIDTTTPIYLKEIKTISIIDSIYRLDQLSKKKNDWSDSIWWKTGQDSIYMKRTEVIDQVDSLNFLVLEKLIQNGSLNNNRVIGAELSILLLHLKFDRFIKIEPELLQMVKKGFLNPWYFAQCMDRKYTDNDQCIIYYAYTFTTDDLTCIPYEKILENRKSIGLSTYYSRPSFIFYIRPGKMMKIPLREFYESELKRKQ